jgi:hypothetical protein
MSDRLTATLREVTRLTGAMGVAFLAAPTGDATALVTDILAPKTAYIATGKVTGTCTYDADTSAGDATDGDIALGKVAYVAGAEVVGTLVAPDLSDATATAADILLGETAYIADGTKATGTCAYDADTTSGDAVAGDIATGKKAWVDGAEVTGTLTIPTVDDLVDNAVVITSLDGSNRPLTADHYGTTVLAGQFYSSPSGGKYTYFMTTVTFKNAVTSVGEHAFSGCNALTMSSLPSGVTSLGRDAFYLCASITSFTLPIGVITMPSYVFRECTAMTTFTGAGITSLPAAAATGSQFRACTALTTVQLGSIGNAVTALGAYVFHVCVQVGLTITVYVVPGTQPLANSPWGATSATIVYRSSVTGEVL